MPIDQGADETSLLTSPVLNVANFDEYNRKSRQKTLILICYSNSFSSAPLFRHFLSKLVLEVLPIAGPYEVVRVPIDNDPGFAERLFLSVAEGHTTTADKVRITDAGLIWVNNRGLSLFRDDAFASSDTLDKRLVAFCIDNGLPVSGQSDGKGSQKSAPTTSAKASTAAIVISKFKQLRLRDKLLYGLGALFALSVISSLFGFGDPSIEDVRKAIAGQSTTTPVNGPLIKATISFSEDGSQCTRYFNKGAVQDGGTVEYTYGPNHKVWVTCKAPTGRVFETIWNEKDRSLWDTNLQVRFYFAKQ